MMHSFRKLQLPRRHLAILLFVTLGVVGSCSLARATDLSGKWSGHWESCVTGHNGPLHANFCRVDRERYRVRFHGRFFKIMPFFYSVDLFVVSESPGQVVLEGESYLGRRLGSFTYHAESDGCHFESSYDSCRDHGWFILDHK